MTEKNGRQTQERANIFVEMTFDRKLYLAKQTSEQNKHGQQTVNRVDFRP